MAKKNDQYWQDRNQDKLKSIEEVTDEDIRELTKIMDKACKDLDDYVRDIYLKYARDNEMSYWRARQYLTQDERKEFQRDLKYYIEKSRDSDYAKAHKKELHSLSVRARVSRIDSLQGRIKMFAGGLHDHLSGKSKDRLSDVFSDSYYRTKHAVEGSNIKKDFAMPGIKDVEEVLKQPWSGKNYSENVWDLTNGFESKLKSALNRGLIQGKHPDEIAREWRKQLHGKDGNGGTVYECRRLMETEAAYISEQAAMKYYKENAVGKYKFTTSGLSNVCGTCIELDEKTFDVDDAVVGVNYPPMHPFCHCTSVPETIFDDEDESQYDLPYEQWYNQKILPLLEGKGTEEYSDKLNIPTFMKSNKGDVEIQPLEPHNPKIVDEYFSLLDVRTDNQKIIDCVKKDMAVMPLTDLDILKRESLVLGETEEKRNIHRKPSKLLKPFVKNQILINVNIDDKRGHFAHEFAHFVADKTDLYENEKFIKVINNSLEGASFKVKTVNGKKYVFIKSDKFVTEYQGRTYITPDELKLSDFSLEYRDLKEYVSVGYQEYIANPENLYKKDKMLYDFFEQEGLVNER